MSYHNTILAALQQAREQYRPAASSASTSYFVVADLALISPMYQTSLASFITMFDHCIEASDKSPDVAVRLRLLTAYTTRFIFHKVQRGLFEQHKLLFSFMLAAATARAAGQVTLVRPCPLDCCAEHSVLHGLMLVHKRPRHVHWHQITAKESDQHHKQLEACLASSLLHVQMLHAVINLSVQLHGFGF